MFRPRRKPIVYVAVVEDDELFSRSLLRLLRAENYHPVAYASAEEFLSDTACPRFDCLILDIALGGVSGFDLARRLAAVGSEIPVIFLSAHDDANTRSEARDAGCTAFVGKTEPREVLLGALGAALSGRGSSNPGVA